jgi:hypothetical protein
MAGAFLLTGKFMDRIPDGLVNLPNKAYWLDPSRREKTHAYLRQWGYRVGSVTIAFIISTMHLVVRVNLGKDSVLHAVFPWLLGAYLLFAGAMTITLLRRFRTILRGNSG